MGRGGICAAAAFAALLPCAALADAPPTDVGAPTMLHIALVGQVPTHCGFKTAPASTTALGEIEQAGTLALPFTLDCNATFDIRLASANGGLKAAHPGTADGFASALDYDIAVAFDTDLGHVADHCAASTMTSAAACALCGTAPGQGLSSGDGVGIGQDGAVTLSWSAPPKRLVAGDYQDTITIIVEARI